MRPQPIQQNPTSFLRKWPRAKRQQRDRLRGTCIMLRGAAAFLAASKLIREAEREKLRNQYRGIY